MADDGAGYVGPRRFYFQLMVTVKQREDGYTVALNEAGEILMIDTLDEVEPYEEFVSDASGRVLLLGLGLGILAEVLLSKPGVTHITAVEIESDLCAYVTNRLDDKRLRIINADCWKWLPSETFDFAYYSIWHLRNLDTWHDKVRLKQRFAPFVTRQYVDWETTLDDWHRIDEESRAR